MGITVEGDGAAALKDGKEVDVAYIQIIPEGS